MKRIILLFFSFSAIHGCNHEKNTHAQNIDGPVDKVFPLYCPVRESLWIDGWSPKAIYSNSGFIEANCVFITPGHGDGTDAIWYETNTIPQLNTSKC